MKTAASVCLMRSRFLPLPTFFLFDPGSTNDLGFNRTISPHLKLGCLNSKSSLVCGSTRYRKQPVPPPSVISLLGARSTQLGTLVWASGWLGRVPLVSMTAVILQQAIFPEKSLNIPSHQRVLFFYSPVINYCSS